MNIGLVQIFSVRAVAASGAGHRAARTPGPDLRTLRAVKVLPNVGPTPEQLQIVMNTKPGVFVVRGEADSGKTTTALLRLRQLSRF